MLTIIVYLGIACILIFVSYLAIKAISSGIEARSKMKKKERLDVDALFDASPKAKYHYSGGFNHKAIVAWILSGYIAVGSVWPNILVLGLDDFFANLGGGGGYAWIIGASLGAVVHLAISKR